MVAVFNTDFKQAEQGSPMQAYEIARRHIRTQI
jgi:hypothetical protein